MNEELIVKKLIIGALICVNVYAEQPPTVTIIGVGDLMLGSSFPSKEELPPDDGRLLLKQVAPILKSSDITFGNLEGVLLDKGNTTKNCNNPSLCFSFRMPTRYVNHLSNAGFNLLSVANNHIGDFGETGRKSTLKVLQEQGIMAAGLISKPTVVFKKGGLKYGFIAFAPNSGTVDVKDIENAKQLVSELSLQADIVIVSMHVGAEGNKYQHVPRKEEHYAGENRGDAYRFAHAVIDAGADVVFGHGPHVTRALELYQDRLIAYSLGNFCTYGRINIKDVNGIAPILKVEVTPEGEFVRGEIISTQQSKTQGVFIDQQREVLSKIKALTEEDFPDTPLHFSENGAISKRSNK
ncbi:MAG: hypothetical protein RIT27_266 [Pseudomonadota bacterium]|jgi:hypothetical protein